MPSSLPDDGSSRSLIPPTPDSDFANSPQSPHNICHLSSGLSEEPQIAVPQKRKAGRKPLYKTAQERRDRNRRAQLAFRARRSDYLARLEHTCRSLESVVAELQESNRVANDALARERNKVRCLERILQCPSAFSSQQVSLPFQEISEISFAPDNNTVPASAEQQTVSPRPL
jgi:hypothetical protein